MALSTRLVRRLEGADNDEPLAKRLKLAENVLYTSDTLIFRKEDCIFRWLCSNLDDKDNKEVWITIHRCLALDSKNFLKVSPTTRIVLIEKLIDIFKDYSTDDVLEEMVKSCSYIFSSVSVQNYVKEGHVVELMEAVFMFAIKVLNSNKANDSKKITVVFECAESALSTFSQSCKQSFSEKNSFMVIFIDKLLFPLSSLVKIAKDRGIFTKIVIETQKCIKRLLLGSIKSIALSSEEENKKVEEAEIMFTTLKNKISTITIESVKTALSYLFQNVVNIFQQNSSFVDIILRKLIDYIEDKEQSKQVLTALIETSIDVSYNFDNEINGISLKEFLKSKIEGVLSKKKHLKCSDYELLTAIAKLNPLIVEDITQNIFEKVLLHCTKNESEKVAQENLIKELWTASVRLRRQHKYLSKFLISINTAKSKDLEYEFVKEYSLPKKLVIEFNEDFKNKTTSYQISTMFNTLIYHLKTDCISSIQNQTLTTQKCLMFKVVAKFFVIFFEYSNFLDNSLPLDWQAKFFNIFSDLNISLALLAESLSKTETSFDPIAFIAFTDILKSWCEAYDLIRYYFPNDVAVELSFPVSESQKKEIKHLVKKFGDQACKESLNQLLFFESVICNRGNSQAIDKKIIKQLWPMIIEQHFEVIETFDENQILELTLHLIQEACSAEDKLVKWTLFFQNNLSRMTKKFASAAALQIVKNTVENFEDCTSKTLIEFIDSEYIVKSLHDSNGVQNILEKMKNELFKQTFRPVKNLNLDKTKRELICLSNLPISFLDTDVRTLLFIILYSFAEETKNVFNPLTYYPALYSDILLQNDINILNYISEPSIFINHFKDDQLVLSKIFKLSLNSLPNLAFWENFVKTDECTKNISSNLLICIDSVKNKSFSSENKAAIHNLSLKLSSKITKKLQENINDPDEISGIRISLKIILAEKKKLRDGLKVCVESLIKNIVENSESTENDKLIHEILQLSLVVLSHRDIFNIPDEVIKTLCTTLIKYPDAKIFSHFLEILKDNEFDEFSKSLSNKTKELLVNGDVEALEKISQIWDSLSKAEAKVARSKLLRTTVTNYFNNLLNVEIHKSSFIHFFKICRAIVTSRRMIWLSDEIIDSIFVVSTECLNKPVKDRLLTCQEALGLSLDFLRSKTDFLLDRLFALTGFFCKLVRTVLQEGKKSDFSDEQTLRILAVDIEKFCTFFAKLKKDVNRISSYLVADLIDISSHTGVLPSYLKGSIDSSISQLLTNSDQYSVSFLSRTLPASTQQVFKTIYDNYTRYHKFTGKI